MSDISARRAPRAVGSSLPLRTRKKGRSRPENCLRRGTFHRPPGRPSGRVTPDVTGGRESLNPARSRKVVLTNYAAPQRKPSEKGSCLKVLKVVKPPEPSSRSLPQRRLSWETLPTAPSRPPSYLHDRCPREGSSQRWYASPALPCGSKGEQTLSFSNPLPIFFVTFLITFRLGAPHELWGQVCRSDTEKRKVKARELPASRNIPPTTQPSKGRVTPDVPGGRESLSPAWPQRGDSHQLHRSGTQHIEEG